METTHLLFNKPWEQGGFSEATREAQLEGRQFSTPLAPSRCVSLAAARKGQAVD